MTCLWGNKDILVFNYLTSIYGLEADPLTSPLPSVSSVSIIVKTPHPLTSISDISILAQTPLTQKSADIILERPLNNNSSKGSNSKLIDLGISLELFCITMGYITC